MFLDGGWGKTAQNFLGQSNDFGIYSKSNRKPLKFFRQEGDVIRFEVFFKFTYFLKIPGYN